VAPPPLLERLTAALGGRSRRKEVRLLSSRIARNVAFVSSATVAAVACIPTPLNATSQPSPTPPHTHQPPCAHQQRTRRSGAALGGEDSPDLEGVASKALSAIGLAEDEETAELEAAASAEEAARKAAEAAAALEAELLGSTEQGVGGEAEEGPRVWFDAVSGFANEREARRQVLLSMGAGSESVLVGRWWWWWGMIVRLECFGRSASWLRECCCVLGSTSANPPTPSPQTLIPPEHLSTDAIDELLDDPELMYTYKFNEGEKFTRS